MRRLPRRTPLIRWRQAVLAYAAENGITVAGRAEKSEYISGKGLKCLINGENILLGNTALLAEGGADISKYREIGERLAGEGKSLIYAAVNGECIGLIAIGRPSTGNI